MQTTWKASFRLMGFLCAVIACRGIAIAQTPADSKRGEFDITFTERSPLSKQADLLKRLGEKPDAAGEDYDLSKNGYKIYLPKNYDPAVPHGIIYYLGYKDTVATPPKWQPIMDRTHLIFISTLSAAQTDWQRAGLALDAVHNLKKRYTIDDKRIYLIGFPQPPGSIPQRTGMAFADLFTGFVHINFLLNYRQVQVPGTRSYFQPRFSIPPGAPMALARQRRYVFIADPGQVPPPGQPDAFGLTISAYEQDGFKNTLRINLADREDAHYPNMSEPWFEKLIAFLDTPSPAAKPASAPAQNDELVTPAAPPAAAAAAAAEPAKPTPAPATKPAGPSEAARLLNLAKSYITARSFPNARTRLQTIIDQYPTDPAAAEAKKLLAEIKDK